MDHDATRDAILDATLQHVPFDGWTKRSLAEGTKDAGFAPDMALRAFPGGIIDVIAHFVRKADADMMEALEKMKLEDMRIRERIAACVRVRLEQSEENKEAIRRALGVLANPVHAALATELTYDTVNAMWYAAGDRSADFNYYTKRALLTPVYTATLLFWLSDDSDDHEATWAFLDRRIEDVMQIQKVKGTFEKYMENLPDPVRAIREGLKEAGRYRPRSER